MHTKLIVSLSVAVAVVGRAAEMDVSQTLAEALKNNPELRAVEARIESTRTGVGAARAYPYNPEFIFEEGLDRHYGVSQTIEWPGKRALRTAVAQKDVVAAEAGLVGFKIALAAEVRVSFYETLGAEKLVAIAESRRAAAEKFLETARKRAEGGFAPVTERTKAQAELVRAQREFRAAQKVVVVARSSLNLLLGREPGAPLSLDGELAAPPVTQPVGKWIEAGLARNPSLAAQRIELEKKQLSVRLAGKGAAPDITVEPFYEHDVHEGNENAFGVAVSVPLPLWNNNRKVVTVARAEERESQAVLEKTRREVAGNVQKAYAALTAAREEFALYSPELLAELEAQLAATQQKYADGQVSFLVLVETQQTYFDYRKDYLETLIAAHVAQADLEKAAGITLEELQ